MELQASINDLESLGCWVPFDTECLEVADLTGPVSVDAKFMNAYDRDARDTTGRYAHHV
jgi:hypothetical protein